MKATRKQHNLDEVIRSLSKKSDCRFAENPLHKTILIIHQGGKEAKHDLGNKSWGKIDFLIHYCGYDIIRNVDTFNQKSLSTSYPSLFYQC